MVSSAEVSSRVELDKLVVCRRREPSGVVDSVYPAVAFDDLLELASSVGEQAPDELAGTLRDVDGHAGKCCASVVVGS